MIMILAGAALCGMSIYSGAATEDATSCQPTEAILSPSATLSSAAGTFRLTLVRPLPEQASLAAYGVLLLSPSTLDPLAFAPAVAPLTGATDIDLDAVGAFPIGDPASTDPAAPGVLVLESSGDVSHRILLRIGSDANRPDKPLFDDGFTVLKVREVANQGFRGSWESRAGHMEARGHFCASRQSVSADNVLNR